MGTRSVYRNPGPPQQFLNQSADADRTAQRAKWCIPSKEQFSMRTGRACPLEKCDQSIADFLAKRQTAFSVILSCPNQQASAVPVDVVDSQTNHFACPQPQTSQQKSDGPLS